MNQKQKIIETYKKKKTTETFDSERSRYTFQKYKHKVEADFLKKAIDSLRKNKIKELNNQVDKKNVNSEKIRDFVVKNYSGCYSKKISKGIQIGD